MKLVDESRIQELLGYADAADHLNCLIRAGVVSSKDSATAIRSVYEGLTALPRRQGVSSSEALRCKCLARWGGSAVFGGAQLQGRRPMKCSRELTRISMGANHCAYDLLMDRSRLS